MNKAPTTFRPSTTQTVAAGATSAASSAFGSQTTEVRIVTTVDAYIEFASSPTATSSSLLIPAFTVEYFRVAPSSKVAVLRVGSTTGSSRVTELTQ